MTTFIEDWKQVCEESDGCTTGYLKKVSEWILRRLGNPRNYKCLCLQHDFDYRFGWKYGVSRKFADAYLREGVTASGHPVIARIMYRGVRLGAWWAYQGG